MVDYPIAIDRVLGLGELPTVRLQRRLARGQWRLGDKVLVWAHWIWFMVPHGALAYVMVRHFRRFDRSAVMTYAVFDIGAMIYWVLPTAPPWYAARDVARREEFDGDRHEVAVRRMMVEYGEFFWKDGWGPLYSVLGGNPLAAMPSLHFATSMMAAQLLSETGPVAGALGWGYTATLGFALVYLGEHYVVDLIAGAALTTAVSDAPHRRLLRRSSESRCCRGDRGICAQEASMKSERRPTRRRRAIASIRKRRIGDEQMPLVPVTRRSAIAFGLFVLSAVAFLYFVLPKLAGLSSTAHRIERGDTWWIMIGVLLEICSFGGYVVLFRAVFVRGREPNRLARELPDHDGWACRHATVRGRRRRWSRPHGLGSAALGHGATPGRLPHGRVHGAAVRDLRGSCAARRDWPRDRLAPGRRIVCDHDRARGRRGILFAIVGAMALLPGDIERRLARWAVGSGRVAHWVARAATVPGPCGQRSAHRDRLDPLPRCRAFGRACMVGL